MGRQGGIERCGLCQVATERAMPPNQQQNVGDGRTELVSGTMGILFSQLYDRYCTGLTESLKKRKSRKEVGASHLLKELLTAVSFYFVHLAFIQI